MKQEIENYRNCFKDQACFPEEITRISFNPKIIDSNLDFENLVNPFIIDQNKISNSKSFRRLSDKTQVFFSPENPHIRNRNTHTQEVVATAKIIGGFLGLNTELIEASALGHDLGHGPAGHLFEQTSEKLGIEFKHERFSGIIATSIERNGDGLNLTKETLKGMLEHSRGANELTVDKQSSNENLVVMYADKISYIFSDVNDLKRLKIISSEDDETINFLFPGKQREQVNQCIFALIKESAENGFVSFIDSETAKNFKKVKEIMYKYYGKLNRQALAETIKMAYGSIDEISQLQKYDPTILLALMTDNELSKVGKIAENRRVDLNDLKDFGVFEIIGRGFLESQNYKDLDIRLQQKIYQ